VKADPISVPYSNRPAYLGDVRHLKSGAETMRNPRPKPLTVRKAPDQWDGFESGIAGKQFVAAEA